MVRLYRYGSIGDIGAEEQAVKSHKSTCSSAAGSDPGLGDESCSRIPEAADDEAPILRYEIRLGADLVMIGYSSSTVDRREAHTRVTIAAGAVLEELARTR